MTCRYRLVSAKFGFPDLPTAYGRFLPKPQNQNHLQGCFHSLSLWDVRGSRSNDMEPG
jgi:hypothetical protein